VKTIADLVREVPIFADLEGPELDLISGCGSNTIFEDGSYIFREGEAADAFYAIRTCRVALELAAPARRPLVIETLEESDVLGWSWLFAPYRTRFDARAVGDVHAIAFDAACLRGKCDADHDLGYLLMSRFARIITERLQATRVRLLDVYGHPATGA
jgi:CRP/FNR family cyclic AMP-dependent transcriptional regulator